VSESNPEPGGADSPTAVPFLAALAIIVLVVSAIGLLNLFDDDEPTPEQQVVRAVVAQNDALQRENYADFRAQTCLAKHGNEAEVIAGQRDSKAKQGARRIDDVTDVTIDGDRASAKVTYLFDNAADSETQVETTLVREDGAWKVC
jgi:hypothetical protein